jgi:hypothetical protein
MSSIFFNYNENCSNLQLNFLYIRLQQIFRIMKILPVNN